MRVLQRIYFLLIIFCNFGIVFPPDDAFAQLPAPSVTASSNFPDHIRASWNNIGGAMRYEVFHARSGQALPCSGETLVRVTPNYSGELLFDYYPANASDMGPRHSFRVRAISPDGTPGFCSTIADGEFSAPIITQQPLAQRVWLGQPATFSVEAYSPYLSYQWQRGSFPADDVNFVDISGATASTYSFTPTIFNDRYFYRVRVMNGAGYTLSNSALLNVDRPPSIFDPSLPQDVTSFANQVISFSVAATGYQIQFQWQVFRNNGWDSVPGANQSTYSFVSQNFDNGLQFRCIVWNGAGSVISRDALLTVYDVPQFTLHPTNLTVLVGQPAQFTSHAVGQSITVRNWQWRAPNANWIPFGPGMPSAFTETLEYAATWIELNQTQFRLCATNPAGTTCSNAATLTVLPSTSSSSSSSSSSSVSSSNSSQVNSSSLASSSPASSSVGQSSSSLFSSSSSQFSNSSSSSNISSSFSSISHSSTSSISNQSSSFSSNASSNSFSSSSQASLDNSSSSRSQSSLEASSSSASSSANSDVDLEGKGCQRYQIDQDFQSLDTLLVTLHKNAIRSLRRAKTINSSSKTRINRGIKSLTTLLVSCRASVTSIFENIPFSLWLCVSRIEECSIINSSNFPPLLTETVAPLVKKSLRLPMREFRRLSADDLSALSASRRFAKKQQKVQLGIDAVTNRMPAELHYCNSF